MIDTMRAHYQSRVAMYGVLILLCTLIGHAIYPLWG